ncbi:MAG: dTDP-glucose 4,6-dehydratase [Acidobacteria bacterium]|nr:dTDP-glucose 4,6-dehydratase [Acidobacteriota bacterium]
MKTLFVTGGAGFIGSEFVRLVLEQTTDFRIINFDALTYAGNLANLDDLDETRHEFVKGDIRDKDAVLRSLPEECDGIINFAAESHVDRSILSANEFITTNVLGTQVLLDCAREKNVRRFLQVSTDEVMGSLPEDEASFFTEDSPLEPNSPYAASKTAAEHFVRAAHETFELDTVITRCGNNYGQRQFPEKLIPLMISNALNDKPLPLYGDGKNVRDWIFVTDHCNAIWRVFNDGKSGDVYNIGSRNTRMNIEVITAILDTLGKSHDLITPVTDRLGHDRRYAIDPTKIETELGWKPETSWEDGLQQTIDWYLNNNDWVEDILRGEYREYYKKMYSAK